MKILGLDLGTNSIGWAVVEKENGEDFALIDKGVRIFQEGVKIEKGNESSKAAERTGFRSARRIKFRRKLRKINVLKTLSKFDYCPELTIVDLDNWRYNKLYPMNLAFLDWQKTDEEEDKNPYYFRSIAASEKLDLSKKLNRHRIGRAFYHIVQRRGFLSNRLDTKKESEGVVKAEIKQISKAKGDRTLGQYFFELYQKGEKIRDHYTHREKHYLEEFERICYLQKLPNELTEQLRKDIFYQRPLKSQKGSVGNCPFEKNKPRCPVSHPRFEEFRALAFINNIQIKTPDDEKLRTLNKIEKELILPLFYRKSKEHFDFVDIAKKLTPKGFLYFSSKSKNKLPESYWFNYSMNASVSGCKTISQLITVFGEDWVTGIQNNYTLKKQKNGLKSTENLINDIWHVLFTYDKTEKLIEFAKKNLGFDDQKAEEFSKIKLKRDYSSLSLKAINKILPHLKQDLIYSHAVFMANLDELIPAEIWKLEKNRELIKSEISKIIQTQNLEKQLSDIVNGIIKIHREENSTWSENEFWQEALQRDIKKKLENYFGKSKWEKMDKEKQLSLLHQVHLSLKKQMSNHFGRGEFLKTKRIDDRIIDFLVDHFEIEEKKFDKLYHPSAIEVYQDAKQKKDGKYYLGSPLISAIKNPMAMRALHQVRKVVNELIEDGTIDSETKVNIEMARDLKNANERKAIQNWQNKREKDRKNFKEQLKKDIKAATGNDIEPTERDILKYQLWEEQNHICLYTGETIAVSEFVGTNPKYDLEHTIPRSLSLDNSQVNLTLCNSEFNRKIKRNKIPSELPNHAEILQRIEYWKNFIEAAQFAIEKATKQSRANSDNKEAKDSAIQKRHFHKFDLEYWRGKYKRFEMNDVPDGFKNSQLVDTGIITKYARLYLKTLFNNVYTVKGQTVSDFRKIWGIQNEYEKKARLNHIHHCIDAVTMACMTKELYEKLANAYHDWEGNERLRVSEMPEVEKPWPTFSEDIREIENQVLVSHYTPDNLPKQSKKKLRQRGKIVHNVIGEPIYQQGDTVRGALHQQTEYGAIKKLIINKKGEEEEKLLYVVRKPLDSLTASDINNIVDDHIRTIIEKGKIEEAKLKKELEAKQKLLKDAESEVDIKALEDAIEQIKIQLANLFAIANKDGSFTPIKKVRCVATTVTNPLHIKKHRDLSKHDYKHFSNFANDSNYMMAIYEGQDKNGKTKRDFILVNNLDAGKYFTKKVEESPIPDIHPKSILAFKSLLKTGTMVILWENEPEEVWTLNTQNLHKRFYKVVGLSINTIKQGEKIYHFGNIVLRHSNEAQPASKLKTYDGLFNSSEELISQRKLSHNQFNALVECVDFEITSTGKLIKIK